MISGLFYKKSEIRNGCKCFDIKMQSKLCIIQLKSVCHEVIYNHNLYLGENCAGIVRFANLEKKYVLIWGVTNKIEAYGDQMKSKFEIIARQILAIAKLTLVTLQLK